MAKVAADGIRGILNPGRMLADGIPYSDYAAALDEAVDLDSWFSFWCRKGEEYERLGEEAIAAGHTVSAGEWLWQASLSFHYAQFMLFGDPPRRDEGQRRKVELYDRAAPYLVPAAERIGVPVDGVSMPGFLRLPLGERPEDGWPCVLLIGGLESHQGGVLPLREHVPSPRPRDVRLRRAGSGRVLLPGQAAPRFRAVHLGCPRRPRSPAGAGCAATRRLGRSLGGYYAPRSAACDSRLKAIVGWGVFFDMSDFAHMPRGTQAGFAFVTGSESLDGGRRVCEEYLDLSDVADRLRAPFYVLQGRHDVVFAPRQLELVLANFPNAQLEVHVEPNGDHCCHNMAPVVRPRMADWIAAQLGARP